MFRKLKDLLIEFAKVIGMLILARFLYLFVMLAITVAIINNHM